MANTTRESESKAPELAITDLIDKAVLQALQDVFSDRHDISTAILDRDANPITFERRHSDYCKEIRQTEAGYTHCRHCDRRIIKKVLGTGGPEWHVCDHGGLLDFAAPLLVSGEPLAFFFIGQIRLGEEGGTADDISKNLGLLHSLARDTQEEEHLNDFSLRKKFGEIRVRTPDEKDTIGATGKEFADELSRALTKLERWHRPRALSGFVAKIVLARDLDQLLDICVAEIPRLLGTENCSIFTVVRGKLDEPPRLVLWRTSYPPSREVEGTVSYPLGQGLTGWVWKNKRALRLEDIERDKSKLPWMYHGLKWSQTVNDSDHHREWLGVPLFRQNGERGDVIGVIRVPEKEQTKETGGGGFTFEDEILLMTIGQHVARQIEDLRIRERVETAVPTCLDCAVELAQVSSVNAVATAILRACERAWGSDGKAHFFNLLDVATHTLTMVAVRGTLAHKDLPGREVPLNESLSGESLRLRQPVIIHDLEGAHRAGRYFPAAKGLECGMSAPIRFGDEDLGALSVGADRRYEFSEEGDLHILETLASLAGAALARLKAQEEADLALSEYSRRAGHTLVSRITTLEATIAALKVAATPEETRAIDVLEEAAEFLKWSADLALRFGHALEPAQFCKFALASVIRRLEKLWQDPRLSSDVHGPVEMVGDPQLVEQILVELVANARRFAPTDGGSITVRAFLSDPDPRRSVVIEVEDNGPGIPEHQKQSLFRPHRTAEDSQGTRRGLGLSIVRRATEAHGGHVQECGQAGRGACFRILLPQ